VRAIIALDWQPAALWRFSFPRRIRGWKCKVDGIAHRATVRDGSDLGARSCSRRGVGSAGIMEQPEEREH